MANSADSCHSSTSFSVEEFFKDSPWLNVPEKRRAQIIIEPLYPRGRLLGGSPAGQDRPPQSKLAALAAARRKKESGSSEAKEANGPVAHLSSKLQMTNIASQLDQPQDTKPLTARSQEILKKHPAKKRQIPEPAEMQERKPKRSQSDHEPVTQDSSTAEPAPIARPSPFAQTLFGPTSIVQNARRPLEQPSYLFPAYANQDTKINPFAGPSPDDVVQNAQTSKGKGSKRSGG